jgi:hypothetical protein
MDMDISLSPTRFQVPLFTPPSSLRDLCVVIPLYSILILESKLFLKLAR